MSRPLNYTTKIPAKRTLSECIELLAAAGADSVIAQYRDRQPSGLLFRLDTTQGPRDFSLPVGIDGMQAVLAKALRADRPHVSQAEMDRMFTRAHAADVAWRVLRDWLEAQLAIIAAQMATLDQVMLPYLLVAPERTLWDEVISRGQLPALSS